MRRLTKHADNVIIRGKHDPSRRSERERYTARVIADVDNEVMWHEYTALLHEAI